MIALSACIAAHHLNLFSTKDVTIIEHVSMVGIMFLLEETASRNQGEEGAALHSWTFPRQKLMSIPATIFERPKSDPTCEPCRLLSKLAGVRLSQVRCGIARHIRTAQARSTHLTDKMKFGPSCPEQLASLAAR